MPLELLLAGSGSRRLLAVPWHRLETSIHDSLSNMGWDLHRLYACHFWYILDVLHRILVHPKDTLGHAQAHGVFRERTNPRMIQLGPPTPWAAFHSTIDEPWTNITVLIKQAHGELVQLLAFLVPMTVCLTSHFLALRPNPEKDDSPFPPLSYPSVTLCLSVLQASSHCA